MEPVRTTHLRAWTEEGDTLLRLVEQAPVKDDPARKAFACYGLLVSCPAAPDTLPEQVWVRFVEKRPVSTVTIQFLERCCAKLDQLGKTVLIMIWDNASWHISKEVRTWLQTHNRIVKQQGKRVRVVAFYLPSKSPWLNRIEPHWVHGKRNVAGPNRLLTAQELAERICSYYRCDHEPHLGITEKVT